MFVRSYGLRADDLVHRVTDFGEASSAEMEDPTGGSAAG